MNHLIKDGVLIIYLTGNLLSEESSKKVEALLQKSINAGNKKLLFNLSAVSFMNSTGLLVVLLASGIIGRAGGELALCYVPEQVKKIIHLIKLENVLTSLPDEEAAIAFLNS
jgi:anti-anti-sigma factor